MKFKKNKNERPEMNVMSLLEQAQKDSMAKCIACGNITLLSPQYVKIDDTNLVLYICDDCYREYVSGTPLPVGIRRNTA